MAIVQIRNKFILALLCFTQVFLNATDLSTIQNNPNYQFYKIDINKDGTSDIVANELNGNNLLYFLNQEKEYKLVYVGENYSYDGIYKTINIQEENSEQAVLSILTIFNGSGGELKKYFINFVDKRWELTKVITFIPAYNYDPNQLQICIQSSLKNIEQCHIDTNSQHNSISFFKNYDDLRFNTNTIQPKKQPLYKSPTIDSKTKMYLIKGDKVEILEEKEDWIYILYVTKDNKEIKAWIPKDSVEAIE